MFVFPATLSQKSALALKFISFLYKIKSLSRLITQFSNQITKIMTNLTYFMQIIQHNGCFKKKYACFLKML